MAGESKMNKDGLRRLRKGAGDPARDPLRGASRDAGIPPELLAGIFEGFLTPEGRFVAIQDADTMFSVITASTDKMEEVLQALQEFSQECYGKGYLGAPPALTWKKRSP